MHFSALQCSQIVILYRCLKDKTKLLELINQPNREKEKNKMTRYDYLEEIKKDLRECYTIDSNTDWERLSDEAFINDSITGNASGSYYCNSYKASEAIRGAEEVIEEACECFGLTSEEMALHLFDYEYWDVTIRCYLLYEAISELREECEE